MPPDHAPDAADSTLARLESTRLEMARARLSAARAADEAEAVASRWSAELLAVQRSAVRQRLITARRLALAPVRAARHPWRSIRGLVEIAASASGLDRLAPIAEHVFFRASPLRARPFTQRDTDQPNVNEAIRWLGPANVRGVVRHALFAHPTSTVIWRASIDRGARLRADCAIVPAVAALNRGGVVFAVDVRSLDEPWTAAASLVLRPHASWLDRHWRSLALDFPAAAGGEAEIRLTSRIPDQGDAAHAWALWGEPRLLWRRTPSDIIRLAAAVLRRDGLIATLSRLRGARTVDDAAEYQRWLAAHTPAAADLEALAVEAGRFAYRPLISVIMPVYNTDPRWLLAAVDSVRRQAYGHWELCITDDASTSRATVDALAKIARIDSRISVGRLEKNAHISAASNASLDRARGEFIALLDHDDELAPEALAEVVRRLNDERDLDFIYSDEDKRDLSGLRCDPYFKPDWSPEHLENFMYTNHLTVLRRSLVEKVGRFRIGFEGAQDYDLVLRVTEATRRIGHVPKVLYHWRKIPGSAAAEPGAKPWALEAARRALVEHVQRRGLDAEILDGAAQGLFRVKRRIRGTPLVTIVIPTDDRSRTLEGRTIQLLPTCVRSVVQKTSYSNYEILVVDNGRISDATRDFLSTVPHRRVSYRIEGEFNFAHKLNFSVRQARGEHLVIFNDDIEVITSEWLSALLEYSQEPEIGAVGAKLFFADGRLQHIGMILGVCGVAAHALHMAPGHAAGYFGAAVGPRNYSAVTGATMMTRRALFEELGGFDERLAIDFNDVDYCLRLRAAGYRIVFTPHAQLYHYESGTQGARTQNPAEAQYMKEQWPEVIARDPYYNPNLTRDFPDYRLGD